MCLKGKVAIVTGGGSGIGRGIVEEFLKSGAEVCVVQRKPLDEDLGSRQDVLGVQADLVDPSCVEAVVEQVLGRFGVIDILVNNAGVMFEREVSQIRLEEWDRMMAINLRAPLFLTQAVVPHMRKRNGGSIINIGSIEGIAANPLHAAYSASKAGIHGLTTALAVDLGEDQIRCNAIAPGWIDSDLSEAYLSSLHDQLDAREALELLHPLRRTGKPEDVGALAVFLASDASNFLTGQTIVLDGGRTSKLPMPIHHG